MYLGIFHLGKSARATKIGGDLITVPLAKIMGNWVAIVGDFRISSVSFEALLSETDSGNASWATMFNLIHR